MAPEQIHLKFNVAYVQIQLAQIIYTMPEAQRTLVELQAAAQGLEDAVISLEAIAQHPQTPYPKHDIEQRANMCRNTMRKQLDRAAQSQKEYEEKNAEKLQAAKLAREAELKRREESKRAIEEAERQKKLKIAEERQKIAEQDRELAEQRAEQDRAREEAEMTTDSETGEKVKRKKKSRAAAGGKRKKKNDDGITDDDQSGAEQPTRRSRGKRVSGGETEDEKPKKKRKLTSKKGNAEKPNKFKSSEVVVESDSDGDDGAAEAAKAMDDDIFGDGDEQGGMDVDAGSEEETVAPVKRKSRRAMIDSDDEDEDVPEPAKEDSPATANNEADGDTPMADSPRNAADSDDE
jgi:RNA polymerase-associated protein CTR9